MSSKYPTFRRGPDGRPTLKDSLEATQMPRRQHLARPDSIVRQKAIDKVSEREGNINDRADVLGEYTIEFGRFAGCTFHWLMENSPGWIGFIVSGTISDGLKNIPSPVNIAANKEALLEYAMQFPESRDIVSQKANMKVREEWKRRVQTFLERTSAMQRQQQQREPVEKKPVKAGDDRPQTKLSPYMQLLRGRQLSTESLRHRLKAISTPPKYKPIISATTTRSPSPRTPHTGFSDDDDGLLEALTESEKSCLDLPEASPTLAKVRRKVLQESASDAAPEEAGLEGRQTESQMTLAPARKTPRPRPAATETVPQTVPSASQTSSDPSPEEPGLEGRQTESQMTLAPARKTPRPRPAATETVPQTVPSASQTSSGGYAASQEISVLDAGDHEVAESDILLYARWKESLPKVDQQWISKAFFGTDPKGRIEFRMDRITKLWFHPPTPSMSQNVRNAVDRFFAHQLFVWMPVNIWHLKLKCPDKTCGAILCRAGVHKRIRMVMDIDSYYIMITEILKCTKCSITITSWSKDILSQMNTDKRLLFPCILTSKYACDLKVVDLLRQRSLGNSSSMVLHKLQEAHSDRYLKACHHYLQACKSFKDAAASRLLRLPQFERPPQFGNLPNHRWLMKIYQMDVLNRHLYVKASITGTFGEVLKMDSTKKVTKKLAGRSAHTAMWATNVGNEFGQIVMSVLTTSEGHGLQRMINGLITRYKSANVPAPKILYVDRDCCGTACLSKYFEEWPELNIRLDIWHFMRRLSSGCTTDAHSLYGTFMNRLSRSIFKWEQEDLDRLKAAKKAEMIRHHIPSPTDADVIRHISNAELQTHCRRMTRGTEETTALISALIEALSGSKGSDVMGVPLIEKERMEAIWYLQQKHVACIQDPEGVQLYIQTGSINKGGVLLPKYRCARGSTSLESFHLHLNRFIPGTLASDVNFQVYLLDGIYRWNEDRRRVVEDQQMHARSLHSYDALLQESCNALAEEVFGEKIMPNFRPPRQYTGELIGIEYLYSQSSGEGVEYLEKAKALEEDTDHLEEVEVEDNIPQEEEFHDFTIPSLEEPSQPQTVATVSSPQPTVTITRPAGPILPLPSMEDYRQMTDADALATQPDIPMSGTQHVTSAATAPIEHRALLTEPTQPIQTDQPSHLHPVPPSKPPTTQDSEQKTLQSASTEETKPDESDLDESNIPGYTKVLRLATFLVSLRELETPMSSAQVDELVKLWNALDDYDKARTTFPSRFSTSIDTGRFKSPKKTVTEGVTSIKRVILGPNTGPANWPNCNRYVEATVTKLLSVFPSDRRSKGKRTATRWILIKDAYTAIQKAIYGSARVREQTEITLPRLNTKTIQQWYNQKEKKMDLQTCLQGLALPTPPMTGIGAPEPKPQPATLATGTAQPIQFPKMPDTAGQLKLKIPVRLLPKVGPGMFPVLLTPSTGTLSLIPTGTIPERLPAPQRPSKPIVFHCKQCGKERTGPKHKQYMGYRYCEDTATQTYEDWKAELQSRQVHRRK